MSARNYILSSVKNRANWARLVAKLVDLFIVVVLSVLTFPLGLFLGIIYIGLSDSLGQGQSVGKRLMGFAVLSLEDGSYCSSKQSVVRNLPIIIPLAFSLLPFLGWIFTLIFGIPLGLLELYLLLRLDTGHRLGDVMADTTVIANDPHRMDVAKRKTSWFDNTSKLSL